MNTQYFLRGLFQHSLSKAGECTTFGGACLRQSFLKAGEYAASSLRSEAGFGFANYYLEKEVVV